MITALLVDDEPKLSVRLAGMLQKMEDVEVIGTAGNVSEARHFLQMRQPDVVFLDVTMPGGLGVDLLPSVHRATRVIFVTATEAAAVAAFDFGAVDYVLKPCSQDRLERAVDRLRRSLGRSDDETDAAGHTVSAALSAVCEGDTRGPSLSLEDKLPLLKSGSRCVQMVHVRDIAWITAMENYTAVKTVDGSSFTVKRKLTTWENILPESVFRRLDRSLLVNMHRLTATQSQSRETMLLVFSGVQEPLPIGRTAASRLKEYLRI
jgi:two-component system LytT family response regulator